MRKLAKDIVLDKLKKKCQVLEEKCNKIQKENASYKRRFTTAIAKADKYHKKLCEMKKAEKRSRRVNNMTDNEPIRRHQYSSLIVALSVAFYTRLHVGSRQVV